MGIVSGAFYICHKNSLWVQRIIIFVIETRVILPTKILGVNPLAKEAMLADPCVKKITMGFTVMELQAMFRESIKSLTNRK
jgi:hypothetical protein